MTLTGLMAFGTRQYAQWVPAPQSPMIETFHGYLGLRDFPHGQVGHTRSVFMSKRFGWVFKGSDQDLATLVDYVRGTYGPGPFLFNDPAAYQYGNMAPMAWSRPGSFVGQRGINALDFFSLPVSFAGTIKNNPNVSPVALSGAAGLPVIGAAIWSPNSTPPAWPLGNQTRPMMQMLIPPNQITRITAWGVENTPSNDPGYFYAVSNVGPTNTGPGAGTKIGLTAAGTTLTIASSGVWQVLDMWVGAGSAITVNDFTTFGALDIRMGATTPPVVTAFETGRGQMPVKWLTADIPYEATYVAANRAASIFQISPEAGEVSMPW